MRHRTPPFLFLLITLPELSGSWSVNNGKFLDAHGRERYFHGVNVVYKSAPYVPITDRDGPLSFTHTDAKLLQQLGMNVVRLGVMWGGVEPLQGVYNHTYINEITKIIQVCESHGIFVLVDFHQDNLAEMFCGEGIPWWAAQNYGPDYRKFPAPVAQAYDLETRPNFADSFKHAQVPSLSDCEPLSRSYNSKMASYALAWNYEDLYRNGRGLRDLFKDYWKFLAEQFKGYSNVIGFELINEPASLWQRNYTESVFLQPLYDVLSAAIHEVDPERVIFFNPATWDNGYVPTNVAAPSCDNGFSHVPGGLHFENRSVYAWHYYDYGFLYNGEPFFQSKVAVAQQLRTMSMVTEFSLEHVEKEDDRAYDHFNYALDLMDSHLLSWMAWSYKGYYPVPFMKESELPFVGTCTGCESGLYPNLPSSSDWHPSVDPMAISWTTAKALARTYAQAVQGRVKSMHFDKKSHIFTILYQFDPKVTAPTVIHVNRELGGGFAGIYAHGVVVTITPGFSWVLEESNLVVSADNSTKSCEVSLIIAPKQELEVLV